MADRIAGSRSERPSHRLPSLDGVSCTSVFRTAHLSLIFA